MAFYANAPLPDTNARQGAQTIRMPSTALLTIDSEDRYKDYTSRHLITNDIPSLPTPYNFTISKNESLMPGFMTRVGVSEVVFPWAIPNINAKTQKIQVQWQTEAGVGTNTITLGAGFYTPAQLAAALQVKIRALEAIGLVGFTLTYGSNGTTVPSITGLPAFFYDTGTPTSTVAFLPMVPNSAAYPFAANQKQLFDLLGFSSWNTNGQQSAEGGFTLCQGTRYVDIVCNQLTNSQAQKDQTSQVVARDMLCRMYVGSAAGIPSTIQPQDATFCPPGCAPTVLYRNYTTPKQIQWIPNQNIPGFLQFQVYDDTGDLLDNCLEGIYPVPTPASGTLDWSMTMLVSEN